MNRRNMRILVDGLGLLDLGLSNLQAEALSRYCDEITLYNRKMNFVGGGERDIVIRHILDSVAAVPVLNRVCREVSAPTVADLGSGAGLPGVPLAICMPEAQFTLIERSNRKSTFLNGCRYVLGLET